MGCELSCFARSKRWNASIILEGIKRGRDNDGFRFKIAGYIKGRCVILVGS